MAGVKTYDHITNIEELDKILFDLSVGHTEPVRNWCQASLKAVVVKAGLTEKDATKITVKVQGNPFDFWTIPVVLTLQKLFMPDVSQHRRNAKWFEVARHMLDYLETVAEQPGSNLQKILVSTLHKKVAEWDAARKKARIVSSLNEGVELLHDWGDGWTLVRLVSNVAFQTEGQCLKHCIGDGHYFSLSKKGEVFFSLRCQGKPKVTLQVRTAARYVFDSKALLSRCTWVPSVQQAKGSTNRDPTPEEVLKIMEFWGLRGYGSGIETPAEEAAYLWPALLSESDEGLLYDGDDDEDECEDDDEDDGEDECEDDEDAEDDNRYERTGDREYRALPGEVLLLEPEKFDLDEGGNELPKKGASNPIEATALLQQFRRT